MLYFSQRMLYPTKIWLAGALIGPVLFYLQMMITENGNFEDIGTIFLIAIFSLLFSIPSWLILSLINYLVKESGPSVFVHRLIVQIAVIIISWVTFYVIFGSDIGLTSPFIPYTLAMSIGVWWFDMHRFISEKEIDPDNNVIDDPL